MEWYQWITFVLSILSFLGLGGGASVVIIKNTFKKFKDAKKEQFIKDVQEANQPLADKVNELQVQINVNKEAITISLRTDMMVLRDQFRAQKYASVNDKAAWMQLYNDYVYLGGNHFQEFVDEWKKEVEAFPTEKPKSRSGKRHDDRLRERIEMLEDKLNR